MKKVFLLLFAAASICVNVSAQRYLTPQFTDVTVQSNVIYGQNFTALTLATIKHTSRQPLACDVYTPKGDTVKSRPIAIFVSGGNFLPGFVVNRPTGSKTDSAVVEACVRFAKLGYTAVAADYRTGWDPTNSSQTARVYTLINASYRGLQDLRSCIRYFKANASNFAVDTNRVAVLGFSTGGYVVLGTAGVDAYTKIVTTKYPAGKFTVPVSATQAIPMIIEGDNGDIEAKTLALAPAASANPVSPWPAGDTMCVPNTPGPSSKFQLAVNFGGATGDLTWLDKNTPPIISIQPPTDPYAPYVSYVLQVPIGGGRSLPVVEVQGGYLIQKTLDSLGVTDAWKKLTAQYDPYKTLVGPRNAAASSSVTASAYFPPITGISPPGLFPIMGRFTNDSGPWEWWSFDNATGGNDSTNISGNGNMSLARAKYPATADNKLATAEAARTARIYIDSMVQFIAPRACITLKLPCAALVTGTQDFLSNDTKLAIYPNPTFASVTFQSEVSNRMQTIELYDLSGRSVRTISKINSDTYTINREGLAQGMYIAKVQFDGGLLTRKLVFQD